MRNALRIAAVFALAFALTGCGALRFGGEGSKLGDGQIDLLTLLGLVNSAQTGDYALLCETVLAAQPNASVTEKSMLQAACRGLLGQAAPASVVPAPPSVVAGSAVPSGDACQELKIAYDIAANACGW